MNKAILNGRWTRDPEVKYSVEGMAVARGTLAVDRRGKKDSEQTADFISVKAFGKIAEHIEKWHHKGMKCVIVGHIQTGSYVNKEGMKVYTTDVIIDEIEFAEVKNSNNSGGMLQEGQMTGSGFMEAPADTEEVFNF